MIALPVADPPPRALAPGDPPAIVAPAPRQVSFGRIVVRVSADAERVSVYVDDELVRERNVSGPVETFGVDLPKGDCEVRAVAHDATGEIGSDTVRPVLGLPRAGRPKAVKPELDGRLQRRLRALAADFPGTTAFYFVNLRSGLGAGWNARARFPAASTVKLAIAVEVMRRLDRIPGRRSWLGTKLRRMLVYSTNQAANDLLEWLGGSQTAGASQVSAMLRRVGIVDTYLYGGYIIGTASGRPIPVNVVSQPSFTGKYTTAYDLARLHKHLHGSTESKGPLITRLSGFTGAEGRHLMYLIGHSADHGKLDRFVRGDAHAVPHKAGWITTARHDAGIVYWSGGAFVAAVMTWSSGGVDERADVLAGRMAQTALDHYEALARAARYLWGEYSTSV
ncbi:MAG TPA: serine hydrolase [Gaiellaceae bacterium]|nr:serine hydrolase [Gaiellaceae bacterium]